MTPPPPSPFYEKMPCMRLTPPPPPPLLPPTLPQISERRKKRQKMPQCADSALTFYTVVGRSRVLKDGQISSPHPFFLWRFGSSQRIFHSKNAASSSSSSSSFLSLPIASLQLPASPSQFGGRAAKLPVLDPLSPFLLLLLLLQ